MNTKRKLGALMLAGGLAMATWAYAQTAFKADGIIQSTQGGFKFPDGSIQTAAHSSSIEYYIETYFWLGNSDQFFCYFDVPAGKILRIESISGRHTGADQPAAYMLLEAAGPTHFLPTFSINLGTASYVFEAKPVGYAFDSNDYLNGADFQVSGYSAPSGSNFNTVNCSVSGRLYDAPGA
ncbi:MAG: hypothetical protein EX260_10175 [Desulfobulbaceae bacterium]|nr:MAG: hypothetical protein EX260_10175 [Desulfobulbaceae bacterium]